jgi:hypothetical protein
MNSNELFFEPMNILAIIGVIVFAGFGNEDPTPKPKEDTKKESCDFLMSSTERTSRTYTYNGGDIYVYNPSANCDRGTTVFCIRRVKVNGLKIDFKLETESNNLKIPLSELNLKANSKVKVDLYHYSFSRPEFLSN